MNRKTLGCYGKSARTSPTVSVRMWGVCYFNTDGTPSDYSTGMRCFTGPIDYQRAHDLKADAIKQAKQLAAKLNVGAKFKLSIDDLDADIATGCEEVSSAVSVAIKNGATVINIKRFAP